MIERLTDTDLPVPSAAEKPAQPVDAATTDRPNTVERPSRAERTGRAERPNPTERPHHAAEPDPIEEPESVERPDAVDRPTITDQVPEDVVDRLLWRDAQHVLARHRPTEAGCDHCGANWPCTAQRLAERADAASRLPWRDGWTTRHDLNGMLTLPEWRAAQYEARRPGPRHS
ncbi:MAG: hypothetical protein WCA46_29840 [Actinocatenispora sp.]